MAVTGLITVSWVELYIQAREAYWNAIPWTPLAWVLVGVGLSVAFAAELYVRLPAMLAAGVLVSDQAGRGSSWWRERLAWSLAFTVPFTIPLGGAVVFAYSVKGCGYMDIGCPGFYGVLGVPAAFIIAFLAAPLFSERPGPVRLCNAARWWLIGLLVGAWIVFCVLVALIPDVG